ncbi:MAG: glycosyltransferase family 4 protein, partial [Minisyncoccota bacterium]
VAWLTEGLVDMGHKVHLFASEDSETSAELHTVDFEKDDSIPPQQEPYKQWSSISDCFNMAKKKDLDVIHSHFNVRSAFFADLVDTPTVISIHTPIEDWMRPFLSKYKHLNYISFSHAQRMQMPELNWVANIYHGVDTTLFALNDSPENYALFLGRITAEKGTHDAIEACKIAGIPLRIAGSGYETEPYWHKEIAPNVNGESVKYFGEVSFDKKIELLQKAKVLVFPTHYNEVFGYAMIEAMSCGTPVIAFNNGSVSEIVKDGKTGFVVNNAEEMAEALKKIDTIDRKDVRKRAETFFSVNRMVGGYDAVYKRIVSKSKK